MLSKQKTLLGRGAREESSRVKGTQENCSATWLMVLGFMVMGLISRLSLANHCDSGSFLEVRASFSQDGFQRRGFWEVDRTYGLVSPLLLTFPELFWLVVAS